MKHSNDYWEQEAYWEMERRRAEKNRKTREQRRRKRADTSALIGGICFYCCWRFFWQRSCWEVERREQGEPESGVEEKAATMPSLRTGQRGAGRGCGTAL